MNGRSLLLLFSLLSVSGANEVASGSELIANELYIHLDTKEKNVVYSPFGVHADVSLAYQGSAGETEKALKEALHVRSKEETAAHYYEALSGFLNQANNVTFTIGNKLYVRPSDSVKPTFQNVVINSFKGEIGKVDFADGQSAATEMNLWAQWKGGYIYRGEPIKESDLDESTRAVLLNKLYFRGNWKSKFDRNDSRSGKFHLSSSETIDLQFMYQFGKFQVSDSKEFDAKVIKLPYADSRFTLVIILPNEIDGIDKLEKHLSQISHSPTPHHFEEQEVLLTMPSFVVDYETDLKEPLTKLGFGELFDERADFSEILNNSDPFYISKIKQRILIVVDEEGSSVDTDTGLPLKVARVPLSHFVVDHPFLFLIMGKVDTVGDEHHDEITLFMGKVYKPFTSNLLIGK